MVIGHQSSSQMKIHQIASARFDGGELPHLGSSAEKMAGKYMKISHVMLNSACLCRQILVYGEFPKCLLFCWFNPEKNADEFHISAGYMYNFVGCSCSAGIFL